MQEVLFHIPTNLILGEIEPHLSDKNLDKCHYVVNEIYEQRSIYRVKTEFVPLKARYLRNILRDYLPIIKKLESHEIIQCDYTYKKNNKCYGFKLANKYANAKTRAVFCQSNLKNTIFKWRKSRIPTNKTHQLLYKQLEKIEINVANAKNYTQTLPHEEQVNQNIAIEKIENKDWYFSADEYGRVHTNITNISRHLRKYLSYKNQQLINIDISNSQPLLLTSLILNNVQYKEIVDGIIPIRCTNSPNSNPFTDLTSSFDHYKFLCETGELYNYYSTATGIELTKVKKTIFQNIFGPFVSAEFMGLFPEVGIILKQMKSNGYKQVAWNLQRLESKIIITNVCRRLFEMFPKAFFTTIHDSILTTEEHVGAVEFLIKDAFTAYGVKPKVRIESYE